MTDLRQPYLPSRLSRAPQTHHSTTQDDKSARRAAALDSLVDALMPLPPPRRPTDDSNTSDEEADAEEAHAKYVDLAKGILATHSAEGSAFAEEGGRRKEKRRKIGDQYGDGPLYSDSEDSSLISASTSPDDLHTAADLIRNKLARENANPKKLAQFSNLYSRLLTSPILERKSAILMLLYRLSGDSGGIGVEGKADEMVAREAGLGKRAEEVLGLGKEKERGARKDENTNAFATNAGARASYAQPTVASTAARGPASARKSSEKLATEPISEPLAMRMKSATANGERPPESALLHDLPFNLQGLSSTNIEFITSASIKLPPTLPVPIISLLHTLAEPCLLYRGLADYVEGSAGGLVGQSLRAAVGDELRAYLGLVARLEGEIRRAMAAVAGTDQEGDRDPKASLKTGVTLRRCVVWTRDATLGLRLMSTIVEEAKNKRGGQLISMIHSFSSSHGDPFVGAYAERLLSHATRPFYDMLRQWIYDGELSDPYKEFFVTEPVHDPDQAIDPRRGATSVWEDKYKLDEAMVPSIISAEFANKVFLIGKSLNFIRHGCGDAAWVDNYSKSASRHLDYHNTAALEASIDEAYKATMSRLIDLMDNKFHLFEHLRSLKRYLLLGQGDFIAILMESLAPHLDRPTSTLYRHTLTAQLEHAIRSSNAQYDSTDALRRLDARMLESGHGEIGWDSFTLEYKIDAPVDVVITPRGSREYLKIFNFLWRIKRVEFAIGSTWRRCQTGARGVLGSVGDKVGADWKKARCVLAEMVHFITQLQYYVLFEVIESSWDQLQAKINRHKKSSGETGEGVTGNDNFVSDDGKADSEDGHLTLDDLISAHRHFLHTITTKGLLSSPRSSSSTNTISFLPQLHSILKMMLAYKEAVDGLYSFSVAEFTRRQELAAKIETRTAAGGWGLTEKDTRGSSLSKRLGVSGSHSRSASRSESRTSNHASLLPEDDDQLDPSTLRTSTSTPLLTATDDDALLPTIRSRLTTLALDYKTAMNMLLSDLAHQKDPQLRFLAVVMNFNEVYVLSRGRSRGKKDKEKEKEKDKEKSEGLKRARENEGDGEV